MKNWSLKTKVAAFASSLTVAALAIASLVILPFVRFHQIGDLDAKVADEAAELFRDLTDFSGAPARAGHPVPARFVPPALRERFVVLLDKVGRELYRSPSMGTASLEPGRAGVVRTTPVAGERCRVYDFEDPRYHVVIAARTSDIDAFAGNLIRGLIAALVTAGTVVFTAAFLFAGRTIRPLTALARAAEEISAANPEGRLPVPDSADEIARLSMVLNRAFERLQNAYAAATRFSADASHQLKTPVAVLRAGLEELRASGQAPTPPIDALLSQTRRLTTLIEDLLLLAQADAGRLAVESTPFDLSHLVSGAVDDLETLAGGSLEVECDVPSDITVRGDRRRVSHVLQNLFENAAKYTPPGGTVRVVVTRTPTGASVSVANTGATIPPGDHSRIFERFRRGTGIGENVRGQGLGLNIARELARAHRGDLVLARSDDQCTEFVVSIGDLD